MFSSQDEDQEKRVAFAVLIAVVLAVVGLAIGVGLWKARGAAKPVAAPAPTVTAVAAPAAPAPVAAPEPAVAPAPTLAADGSGIAVATGVVKFYFGSGKTALPAGAQESLADILKAIEGGKTAVISGFADPSGNAAQNAELSKKRAFAVRDLLKSLGVADDKIELAKPADISAGATTAAEGRRVEVTLK
jgi:outer membrane protein OmpA-like peptidoglycan-associated protein